MNTTTLTEFHLMYQEIFNIYVSKDSAIDKWNKIAPLMHEKENLIHRIFYQAKKNDARKEIHLDYELAFDQVQKQLSQEKNDIVKISLVILSLHHVVYDLMSQEGNYQFTLDGREEMDILKKNIIYYNSISVKVEQNIPFHAFILLYALESLFNRHFYVGVDFEYTNKKIQLAQLNFEHNVSLKSFIMLVSPNELEPQITRTLVDLIFCNKYIKKILHGSDSLDVPYVYNFLLQADPNKIIRFTRTLIDTRFLCEYYKLSRDQPSDNKCSIYAEDPAGSAIYYFKVVSDEQQAKLSELLQSMPAPHDIMWNIHKIPKSQMLYAIADVIYLKYFYYRMIYVATEDETNEAGKKSIIQLYKHVLNEITRFVYLERNNITFLMAKCKEEVDVVNNYFIRKQGGILKMIDIYNKVSVGLESTNPRVVVDKLTK